MSITEIKKSAKLKLSGNYIRCASSSLLYFIIVSLLTFSQTKIANQIENSILLAILHAVILLLEWILGYGIIANILNLIQIKTNSITDFINYTLKNGVKYIKIGLNALVKILIPLFLFLFAAFYWTGTAIANINQVDFLCFYHKLLPLASCIWIITGIILLYFILNYALLAYIYHEKPEMNEKEIVKKSKELMRKNKLHYILLLLSFFHWILLGAFILFLLNIFIKIQYLTPFMLIFYSALRPYVITCKSEFYNELNSVEEEK